MRRRVGIDEGHAIAILARQATHSSCTHRRARTKCDRFFGQATARDRMDAMPKVREAIKLIEADGWQEMATKGSHRQFKHPTKPGRVTIAGKPSDDSAPGTYNSILKQAGLKG